MDRAAVHDAVADYVDGSGKRAQDGFERIVSL